ncbi:unnamed protein product [Meloidogyne enterolobii]|uniref:Uncharacterized protein n=1 Tax=Meloidogyne enterolobii TaxID=390850 RepID=A0ACB0XVF9_MELEN
MSELYNQQIKTFEEKIAKNNFENLKEIYSIQEKLLEKIEEKNNEGVDNKKLKEIKEKIKLLNKESVDKFNEIKQVILDQSETTLNKFSVKQKLIEELKEKLASNENNVDSVQELIGEHSDKLKFLQTQVDVLQNHRDLFGRVDEVERSVFDINDKLTDLSNDLIQLKKENWNRMSYINFGNRWGYVADTFAATQKVPINNNLFTNELGTVKISGDQHVEYIPSEKAKSINNMIRVYGQFKFNKEAAEPTCNSLFYFEVKFNIVKKQSEKVDMASIGVDSINGIVTFVSSMMPDNCPKCVYICCSKYGKIRFPEETWKDGDVCGCGVVLPPKSFSDKKPYIFFTKNGKLFGKAVALENIADLFRPFIGVHSCTVDGNFGEDLEKKPFLYDTTKHVTPTIFKVKEFDLVAKYA